jgi:oxygen-independent coproporphyrinogen-3 oxidase
MEYMTGSANDNPPWLWPRAAYVHVPFCAHHCGYCDFAVAVGQDHLIDRYLDALGRELATLCEPQPVRTLFLGGGTPSHLDAAQLEKLLGLLRRWLPLAAGYEFSIEANPDSLGAGKIALLADHGVNRVSLGAQSFQAPLLRVLERRHQPAEVARAVADVKRRVAQVSLDLIFGAPGQTVEQWRDDLRQALALPIDHISTYGLTYEKGTRLWKQRRAGEVRQLDEETERALYVTAMDELEAAGFEHYEISNFARPGSRSRHNQVYWANEAYFGFGLGAARYVLGRRELNTRDLGRYLRATLAGEPATFQSEELTPAERALETVSVQLRRSAGVERAAFQAQTGFALDALVGAKVRQLVGLGLLADDGAAVRLTRAGKCVADAVVVELLAAAPVPAPSEPEA